MRKIFLKQALNRFAWGYWHTRLISQNLSDAYSSALVNMLERPEFLLRQYPSPIKRPLFPRLTFQVF